MTRYAHPAHQRTAGPPASAKRTRAIVFGAAAVFIVGVLSLHLLWPLESGQFDSAGSRVWAAGLYAYPVAAAFVLTFRPGNRVGWALACTAVAGGLLFFAGWAGARFETSEWSRYAEVAGRLGGVGQVAGLIGLIYLFPTGRPVSARFARLWAAFLAAGAVQLTFELLCPRPLEATERPNPLALLPAWSTTVVDLGVIPMFGFLVAGIVSLVIRWRRAAAVERAQLKWFIVAASLAFAAVVGIIVTWNTGGESATWAVWALIIFAFWAIPVSIAIAILRHRLYDIDRIINRTLVYGSLTAATIGAYAGLVIGLSALVRAIAGQESNALAVAATTLIVAALFQPARRRIQAIVDRRFYRSRYDAARTLEAFQGRLRDEVDLDMLRNELAWTVQQALQPQGVGVWLQPVRDRNDPVAAVAYRNDRGKGLPR